MSSGSFSVQPDALERTASSLSAAADRLGGVSRALRRTSTAACGDDGLAEALDDFSSHWRHGLGQLGEAADAVAQQLREAARAYRATDDAVAAACGG